MEALADVWHERKKALEGSSEYQTFVKKLQNEWAIETGLIERLYTWDRGVTEVLIEQGIEASLIAHRGGLTDGAAHTAARIIQDQKHVVEGLFEFVKGERPLSEHYIRQMHGEFTAHQEGVVVQTADGHVQEIALLRGEYKRLPNNPLRPDGSGQAHPYCPPEHVQQEMENLLGWFHAREQQGERPEVLSAFLHHRFTQIHPFQDGNGRVARALATIVFLKHGLFPLVIRESARTGYIEALEAADQGELKPLCDLFARNQKQSILAALGLEQRVSQTQQPEAILKSGIMLLKNHLRAEMDRMNAVFGTAHRLHEITDEQLARIKQLFCQEIDETADRSIKLRVDNHSTRNEPDKRGYFRREIVHLARQEGYFANFDTHGSCSYLTIISANHFQFVVSFHGFGSTHQGVMAAMGCTLLRIPREGERGKTEVIDLRPASPDPFQFNYLEPLQSVENRFTDWLNKTLTAAMAEWRQVIARETGTGR
ncbi:MAG: Fic family protein [Magnetococcus sp. MYC-9]